tara:strand:+ start:720 stop:863 length:144 start_codon:yes stop_codon:yes gene_type:complete
MEYSEEILQELFFIAEKEARQGKISLLDHITTAIQIVENRKGHKICG